MAKQHSKLSVHSVLHIFGIVSNGTAETVFLGFFFLFVCYLRGDQSLRVYQITDLLGIDL